MGDITRWDRRSHLFLIHKAENVSFTKYINYSLIFHGKFVLNNGERPMYRMFQLPHASAELCFKGGEIYKTRADHPDVVIWADRSGISVVIPDSLSKKMSTILLSI